MKQFRPPLVIMLTCMIFAPNWSKAATITLQPHVDGTISYSATAPVIATNLTRLDASFSQTIYKGILFPATEYVFSLQFDHQWIGPGDVVTSATLSWKEQKDDLALVSRHPLYGAAGDGLLNSESDFLSGTQILPNVANNTIDNGRVAFDVTSFIRGLTDANAAFSSFTVENADPAGTTFGGIFGGSTRSVGRYTISSRLDPVVENRPTLVLRLFQSPADSRF